MPLTVSPSFAGSRREPRAHPASPATAIGDRMSKSRRRFLTDASAVLLGATAACRTHSQKANESSQSHEQGPPPPGAPPAFGTAPAVGPAVAPATFAEAEKLVNIQLTASDREQAAGNWRKSMAPLYERRTGPRKAILEPALAPYSRWDPVIPSAKGGPPRDRFAWSHPDSGPLPAADADIAFAPLVHLAGWIQKRQLTSERLARIYLERIKRFDPGLRCVISLTSELALSQAKKADQEIAAGKYRGPLHGVPWGAKDLLDTAGIPTTYGAEPFRNRVPGADAVVVKRLNDGRGCDAGPAGNLRTRLGGPVECREHVGLRRERSGEGSARRIFPGVDEGEPGDRCRPRRPRGPREGRHGSG